MDKSGWKCVFLKTETAKLYARNKVEWFDNAGRKKAGVVDVIIGDNVSVKGDDGATYVVNYKKLKKILSI